MVETKSDKKQITLSFKTRDLREVELYEYFSQAMGRQALMKGILWEYYQKAKEGGYVAPSHTLNTISIAKKNQDLSHSNQTITATGKTKKKKNTPGGNALRLLD